MHTLTPDVGSIVRDWTPEEKKLAPAVLISDTFAENGEQLFTVADENERSLAMIQPFRFRAEPSNLDDSTPYGREMLRRAASPEESFPLDELMAQWDKEEEESVFSPRVNQTPLSDGSERWFDVNSARKWNEALVSKPDGTTLSKATGVAWKHETLCLTRCGTFIMHLQDWHDYPTDRYVEWDEQQALKWLAANGHEVSLERLEKAKGTRKVEV